MGPKPYWDGVCQLEVGPATRRLHKPTCTLNTDSREDRIAQAIGDPGSILPRKGVGKGRSFDPPESVVRWSTRAVIAVIESETTLPRGFKYVDDAHGGDHVAGTRDLRCQTRVVNTEGVSFRCALSAYHPLRQHDFEAERACRACGCTEYNACDGGCGWAEPDRCTACPADATAAQR